MACNKIKKNRQHNKLECIALVCCNPRKIFLNVHRKCPSRWVSSLTPFFVNPTHGALDVQVKKGWSLCIRFFCVSYNANDKLGQYICENVCIMY